MPRFRSQAGFVRGRRVRQAAATALADGSADDTAAALPRRLDDGGIGRLR